jgi:hypothetical protein
MAVFTLIACYAVYAATAPRFGVPYALGFTAVSLCLLMLGMLAHERRRPVVLKIGPDYVVALSRAGTVVLDGRVVGFSQWTGLLLVLAIAGKGGADGISALLVPADSLTAGSFRELAVRVRHAVR